MINWNNFSGGGMNVTALRLVKFTPERLNKLGVSSVTANDIKAGFITVSQSALLLISMEETQKGYIVREEPKSQIPYHISRGQNTEPLNKYLNYE